MLYIEKIKGESKKRIKEEAIELLENKDKIPFDDLE